MKIAKTIVGLFVLIVASLTADAAANSGSKVQVFGVGGKVGTLAVSIRKDGHLLGEPYVIELRPSCGTRNLSVSQLMTKHAQDVKSACLAYSDTVKFDKEQNKITVTIQEVDYAYQSDFILKHPKQVTRTRCLPDLVTYEFDLLNLCKAP